MTTVFAPGRVNLIGEHTDYTGGLVLPMALELGVTFTGEPGGDRMAVTSEGHEPLDIDLETALEVMPAAGENPGSALVDFQPAWARYLLAVAARLGVSPAVRGSLTSTLPIGGTGLSSSTALSCAALLLYGATGDPLELAKIARQAEIDATGLEIGLMDQAASMACRAGRALLMDCGELVIEHVEVPESIEVLVVHSGQSRQLADSAYRDRFEACKTIEGIIGPLRDAGLDSLADLGDGVLEKRARHVITENQRVVAMVEAFTADDPEVAGEILAQGHASLADDYEVSIPIVDELVARLTAVDGVYGARMTGGGFGGSIVAFCRPGTEIEVTTWWTRARPGAGARVIES
ncbi:MAG: galactokinase [Acidimicrobiales bacterium]